MEFFSPRFLFVELFKHKERLARAAKVAKEEMLNALHTLVSRLELVNEANIPLNTWVEAYRVCREVDEKDTAYVALTLHLDGRLWTHDGRAAGQRVWPLLRTVTGESLEVVSQV